MERARDSDSETHVKKYNWTSGTDLSKKSLWDIFFGAPCRYIQVIRDILHQGGQEDQGFSLCRPFSGTYLDTCST